MRTATMSKSDIEKRITLVNEVVQVYDRGDYAEVIFNAHGDTVHETLLCMKNLINLIRCPFKLSIIHGYNHGQAILTAVRTAFRSPRSCRMYTTYWNPGITHFWVDGDAYYSYSS